MFHLYDRQTVFFQAYHIFLLAGIIPARLLQRGHHNTSLAIIIAIPLWKLICQGGITLKLYIFLFRVCKPMIFTVPLKLNNNYL